MEMLREALRLIRVYHDLRQGEAADRLGVSRSFLNEIERGTKNPTIQLIEKYATTFDIPASSILFFAERLEDGDLASGNGPKGEMISRKVLGFLSFLAIKSGKFDEDSAKQAPT